MGGADPMLVVFALSFLCIWNQVCLLVSFILRHINVIGHIMPNQIKENKSEKKFKGEVLGINDKL